MTALTKTGEVLLVTEVTRYHFPSHQLNNCGDFGHGNIWPLLHVVHELTAAKKHFVFK